jgi:plastocyanin
VYVRDHAFNPRETRIRPGDDVTWVFGDREPHTVTADNNSFDSGKRQDGEFRLRFDQPGSYSYHCAIHPDMHGRVLVG